MSTPAGVVAFDPAAFRLQYPAFTGDSDATLNGYFVLAQVYLNNSAASVVQDLTVRAQLLYLITAHIAFLLDRIASGDGSNAAAVGQMQSASEGGVSAAFAAVQAKNAAFWVQSQYGFMFWQMSLPYRTFRYFAAPVHHVYR